MNFSAVILAGGRSRRMGRDKAWITHEGKTLLYRQIELMQSIGVAEVFISGRLDTDYDYPGVRILRDRLLDSGPLAGVERALDAAEHPLVLVLAVDMAEMTTDVLRQLATRCGPARGVIPKVDGRVEPLAAIYPKASWPDAAEILIRGSKSVTLFAKSCIESRLASFHDIGESDAICFKSWNSPEDIPGGRILEIDMDCQEGRM